MCGRKPAYYAIALLAFAILAKLGLADRTTVMILAIVLPFLAIVSIYRGRGGQCA